MLGEIITNELFTSVFEEWPLRSEIHSDHGPEHWFRVERNGLFLASMDDEVDPEIISLFALFHDSQRHNEYKDPQHGPRGGALAKKFFDEGRLNIRHSQCQKLIQACSEHTSSARDEDPTIQACFEADRLDLWRVGYVPDPRRLVSDAAKEVAVNPSILDCFQVEYLKRGLTVHGQN